MRAQQNSLHGQLRQTMSRMWYANRSRLQVHCQQGAMANQHLPRNICSHQLILQSFTVLNNHDTEAPPSALIFAANE